MTKVKRNYLVYPCKVMNITQSYDGKGSHKEHYLGVPCDYPIDEACEDTGRSWFYCPCDRMKVVRIYTKGTNTIWLQSVDKVITPLYGEDYVTITVTHPEDDDLKKIKVGDIFMRGSKMFREGKDGNATGNHFHISVGLGKMKSIGWVSNSKGAWVSCTTNGMIKPQNAFFIDEKFTTIKNSKGINFLTLPNKSVEDIAKDVIKGKYGNGTERKKRLEAEGYNYSEVQAMVNKILKGVK